MPPTRLSTARRATPKRRRAARATPRPPALPEQDGRERILTAAIRSFSEVGYAGTTTAGIARAAGVTQPLVHHHFGSKDGLWRAAMDLLFSTVPSLATPVDAGSPPASLVALVERFIRFVAARPEATRVIAREGAAPGPRLDYLLKHHLHAPFHAVVDLVRAAQRTGVVAADLRPELLLFLILGAGSHLFDVTALARRSFAIDTAAAGTADAFAHLIRTLLEQGLFRRDP